jgi:hypothetical protein
MHRQNLFDDIRGKKNARQSFTANSVDSPVFTHDGHGY